jgi:hypothetical protein
MTTTRNDTGFKTFTTAAAITEGQRVKCTSAGLADVAGATDPAIGTATAAAASGGLLTVKLFGGPGTFLVVAAAAITRGAQLYPAAAGEVDDSGTTKIGLVALEAATAQGDIIEAAPCYLGA